tara:strand:+ start:710 stop:1102 length:393 start_codon:yes stop_codon:yes gene_type:complete
MDKSTLLKGFNNQLEEFLNDLVLIFPEDNELKTLKISLLGFRKVNPKLIIEGWKCYINDLYYEEIKLGNLQFFINKDYKKDVGDANYKNQILKKIEELKNVINLITDENRSKTIKYVQNLSDICKLYYEL